MIKDMNNIRILVITDDEDIKNQAIELNVNYVLNSKTAIEKIKGGWDDFDIVVTTLEMSGRVECLAKYLIPRGKMPTVRDGAIVSKEVFPFVVYQVQYFSNAKKPDPVDYSRYSDYRLAYPTHMRSLQLSEFLIENIYWDYWDHNTNLAKFGFTL